MDEVDEVIQEFLGDDPRAGELRSMRQALHDRLRAFQRELATCQDADDRKKLTAQIDVIQRQIEVIDIETAATQFVEDSIKVSLARPGVWGQDDLDEDE